MYRKLFEGKVSLIEERELLGKSENTEDALKDLQKDNDNSYDAHNFLKARMIDVLFADWDRHGDQFRFYNRNPKGEDKYFTSSFPATGIWCLILPRVCCQRLSSDCF